MDQYTQKIIGFLKHYKISSDEYSLNGKANNNQVYILHCGNTWEVHSVKDENDRVRGIFFNDYDAINFMYYLVMKNHVKIRKCWW